MQTVDVIFKKPFNAIPTIVCTLKSGSNITTYGDLTAFVDYGSVTKKGFTIKVSNSCATLGAKPCVSWIATVLWNSKTIKNTVGEFFSENTNINNVNFIANYGVMTVNIVTNIIDIKEDMILCTITERYKPASDIYTIGYIYDPKAFVQLVVDTHGNIKVFGKHTVKGKLRIFLTYVLR